MTISLCSQRATCTRCTLLCLWMHHRATSARSSDCASCRTQWLWVGLVGSCALALWGIGCGGGVSEAWLFFLFRAQWQYKALTGALFGSWDGPRTSPLKRTVRHFGSHWAVLMQSTARVGPESCMKRSVCSSCVTCLQWSPVPLFVKVYVLGKMANLSGPHKPVTLQEPVHMQATVVKRVSSLLHVKMGYLMMK